MSAVIVPEGTSLSVRECDLPGRQDREARMFWRELVHLAGKGGSPSDQSLEPLFARAECLQ
jgi:hypothetical protein